MRKKSKIVPGLMILPLLLALAMNAIAYNGTRLVTAGRVHYDISNRLDAQIPFVPWTILIYFGSYIFWAVNYVIGCRQSEREAFRFISADFAAKILCMLCFLAFPTTNVRPAIEGHSVWEEVMRFLYFVDAADNLFPSIHCMTSWFCYIAVRRRKDVWRWYRAASFLIAMSICISTLTTKQHVLIDVFAGIALAEGSYRLVEKSGFSRIYETLMRKAYGRWKGRKSI